MRDVYVVTHPEATHHIEGLVGGWYDAPLTARGEADAHRIAAALADLGLVDVSLVASDLRRTKHTAELIGAALGVAVTLDEGLREQSYGIAGGRPTGTLPWTPPPKDGDRLNHDDGLEGSETRGQVATRVSAALERHLGQGGRTTVVVGHGGSSTYLIAAWLGMPVQAMGRVKFRLSPGSITHLSEDDFCHDRQLVRLNDVRHLDVG